MPLTDIKVIDITVVVSGPFCTKLFADFGVDVIKNVFTKGDPSRVTCIISEGEYPYCINRNRNKHITTDLFYSNEKRRGEQDRDKQNCRRKDSHSFLL